jgi:serine/threonine protein phosphatase PrpC
MAEQSHRKLGFSLLRGLRSHTAGPAAGGETDVTPWAEVAPLVGQPRKREWGVTAASVTGASHQRSGLPNQDAIGWSPTSGSGLPLVVAVSDGHGSAKCFRSDRGSRFAVKAATTVLEQILLGDESPNPSAIKRVAEEWIPQNLVRRWRESVEEDLRDHPLTAGELDALEKRDGNAARQAVEDNPALAYGATLLVGAVAEEYALYLQLGDGDILTVADSGEVSRALPKDERLIANETTSLCSPNAWHEFRVHLQVLSGSPPALVLLSSDGYANSFRDEPSFLKIGSDLLRLIRTEGAVYIENNLEAWLMEASQSGSGDDITLGIVRRGDVGSADEQLKALRTQMQTLEDYLPRIEGCEKRFESASRSFLEARRRDTDVAKQLHRLRLGVLFALFLAGANLGIAVTLLFR